jgi:hypothetical protein
VSVFLSHHPALYAHHRCPTAAAQNLEERLEEHERDEQRDGSYVERAHKFHEAAGEESGRQNVTG